MSRCPSQSPNCRKPKPKPHLHTPKQKQIQAHSTKEPALAERWYRTICDRLQSVWEIREKLATTAAQTRSWKSVVDLLSRVSWYGGSGFHAKEACQDMLHTIVFQRPISGEGGGGGGGGDTTAGGMKWETKCDDLNTYCPIGPGARR